ncbi:MAG: hypothetical protein JWM68_4959, partial [Verrucomicrobiales bacterium]|nr:hypothetical protein [Verrucomicrobiales bacterium]
LVQVTLKLMSGAKLKAAAITTVLMVLATVAAIGSLASIYALRLAARPEIQGSWQGILKTSGVGVLQTDRTHTRVVCKITTKNGVYVASLDLIDVARKDIPVSRFVYNYPSIRIEPSQALQTFQGTLNKDGTEITGLYGQAASSVPLVLKRTKHPDAVPEPLDESDYAVRTDSDLQGVWQGTLGGTFRDLKLSFKIAEPTNGMFRAELDNPQQGFNRQPVSVTYDRPGVKLIPLSGDGMFEGTFSNDRAELAGNWMQAGVPTPVTFRRTNATEPAGEPEKNYIATSDADVQGHWKGSIDINGAKFGATFHIALLPDRTFSASLTSLDLGATDEVPASTVRCTAPKVSLEWKSLDLAFNGGVKNGKLTGVLSQAGMGIPVELTRSKTK